MTEAKSNQTIHIQKQCQHDSDTQNPPETWEQDVVVSLICNLSSQTMRYLAEWPLNVTTMKNELGMMVSLVTLMERSVHSLRSLFNCVCVKKTLPMASASQL